MKPRDAPGSLTPSAFHALSPGQPLRPRLSRLQTHLSRVDLGPMIPGRARLPRAILATRSTRGLRRVRPVTGRDRDRRDGESSAGVSYTAVVHSRRPPSGADVKALMRI
jgi:hypothetical protein